MLCRMLEKQKTNLGFEEQTVSKRCKQIGSFYISSKYFLKVLFNSIFRDK